MKKRANSLYIHIPFCRHICPYCDFLKLLKNKDFEAKYVKQLIKDLSFFEDKSFKFKTIYIGGGTPSCLEKENLIFILSKIKHLLANDYEFSIEVNPEDITENLLKTFKKYGINRISIGIQTFDEKTLDSIKRNYHINYKEMICLVKKYIKNINLDFIYGLPGYSKEILENDLKTFFLLDVNHASFYSLIVEKGTLYYKENVKEIDDDISREYYDLILNEMRQHGFNRYEVSNYSKPGFECEHNLAYWKNKEYYAIGIGSSGYVGDIRYKNSSNFNKYINGINEVEKEKINTELLEEYYLITNLRLESGFSLLEYKKIFKKDFESTYKEKINTLLSKKLVSIKNNRFFCTDEGLILLDQVLLILI